MLLRHLPKHSFFFGVKFPVFFVSESSEIKDWREGRERGLRKEREEEGGQGLWRNLQPFVLLEGGEEEEFHRRNSVMCKIGFLPWCNVCTVLYCVDPTGLSVL